MAAQEIDGDRFSRSTSQADRPKLIVESYGTDARAAHRAVGVSAAAETAVAEADLVTVAMDARQHANAPYVNVKLGAAARAVAGRVHAGVLFENVSLAMCAERVAMFATVGSDQPRIVTLALVAPRTHGELTLPCGDFLQVSLESGGPDVEVIAVDLDGTSERDRLRDLGPCLPSRAVHCADRHGLVSRSPSSVRGCADRGGVPHEDPGSNPSAS